MLASTHFTFLKPTIRAEFGDALGFVDSAGTVVAEVATTLKREGLTAPIEASGSTTYLFTGDLEIAHGAVVALFNSDPAAEATVAEKLVIQFPSTAKL